MSDKVAILVVIVFVVLGFVFLNNLNQEPGKISPVAKLVDLGGLARIKDKKEAKIEKTKIILTSDLRDYLAGLVQRRKQIEQQRQTLLNNRKYFLDQLMVLNGPVEENVKPFIETLEKERKLFIDRYPELEKITTSIEETFKLSSQPARQEKYQKIKLQITALFDKVIKDIKTDVPRLKVILAELERIVTAGKGTKITGCENSQQCLDESINYIKEELDKLLDEIVEDPTKRFNQILDLNRVLTYENKILLNNSIGTEERLEKVDKIIELEYQEIVEKLVDATEKDMLSLMEVYKKLEKEYLLLLRNLDENRLRFYQANKNSSQGTKSILNYLKEISRFDVSALSELFDETTEKRKELLFAFEDNEKIITEMIFDKLEEKYNIIFIIADTAHIDLEKLLEERNTEMNNTQPTGKPTSSIRASSSEVLAKSSIDGNKNNYNDSSTELESRGYDKALLERRQQEVERQMKKEVNEARWQGFYNN